MPVRLNEPDTIDLIIDHHTRTTVPSGTQLVAVNEFKLRLDQIIEVI